MLQFRPLRKASSAVVYQLNIPVADTGQGMPQNGHIHFDTRPNSSLQVNRMDISQNQEPTTMQTGLLQGMLAYQAGEYLQAVKLYRKILDAEPRNCTALHHLGMAMYKLDRPDDAVRLIVASLHVEANQPDAHMNLARIHFNRADYEQAVRSIVTARELGAGSVEVLELLGRCYVARSRFDRAMESFAAALAEEPENLELGLRMADACENAGDGQQAADWYTYVLERDPRHRRARLACTLLHRRSGRTSMACDIMQEGLALSPDDLEMRHNLAAQLDEMGRFDEARAGYLAVLEKQPEHALSLGSLVRMKGYDSDQALVTRAEETAKDPATQQFDKVFLHYSLGRHYDYSREFPSAFEHYASANRLQAATFPYLGNELEAFVESVMRTWSRATLDERSLQEHREEQCRPIFIVGMPRSGTTLTEQILASHPAVGGGGEIGYFVGRFGHGFGEREGQDRFRGAAFPSREVLLHVRQQYLHTIRELDATHRHVTDKMPFNFLHLGWIRAAFPSARVVHCMRDPLDTALSCFFENLTGEFSFAMSFERLAHYFGCYRRLMEHWHAILGDDILRLSYEDLVNDQNATSRRLVKFCGLPWDDACLRFHETERVITTPSNWQVRQPIYASSIGRWRNYEHHLAALIEMLRPLVDLYASDDRAAPLPLYPGSRSPGPGNDRC